MFDFAIFSLFTLAVIFIGFPGAIYLLKKGIEGFLKYRFSTLPENFMITSGLGKYSVEVICYGSFMLTFVLWYLFIDKGGQLFNFINKIVSF